MSALVEYLFERADAAAPAVLDRGRWYSYGELAARMRSVAGLVRQVGAGAAPVVVVAGESSFSLIAAYLGVLHAGAVAAPVPAMPDASLAAVLAEARPPLVLADAALASRYESLGARHIVPLDAAISGERHSPATVDPAATAVLVYTSGSTGRPRGVMLSAQNLRFNAGQINACLPLTPRDRALVTLSFQHSYGLSVLHTHLRRGASLVLADMVYPAVTMDLLVDSGATGLPAVPTLFNWIVEHQVLRGRSLPALRYLMCAGGRLRDDIARELIEQLPGVELHIRYGATEASAAASFLPPSRLADKLGSIGRGLPAAPLLVRRADGSDVPPGSDEDGEIVIRGRHVALGYHHDPVETARSFAGDAFLTGDRARVDADGFVFIVGRSKDFIKSNGYRVAPQEVEDVLAQAAGVAEVAVFGVPDLVRGEAIVAVIVARDGASATPSELRALCAAKLPPFMVPSRFVAVAALPRTYSGKLDRAALPRLLEPPV